MSCLQEANKLDGLLCLWDSDADVLSQSRDFAAKAVTQLQTAAQTAFAPPLVRLTAQAVGTGVEDQPTGLGAGPLWGLVRTVRNEYPDLCFLHIDLSRGPAGTVEATALAPLLMLNAEPEVAMRQGRALAPRMQRVDRTLKPANQPLLRPDGPVLITGSLAGLGARVACWLASIHGIRDLVLTPRRGMEAPGAAALVDRLVELGDKATVVAGDIADPDLVQSIMTAFTADWPLRGVFHAAGVPDAGVLSTLTPQRCATTFAPKVDGAWHLHQFTQQMDLDVFVVVSSISGVIGMPGLGIYAAVNAFLDALMHAREAQGMPATSVAYGPLSGLGMADGLSQATRVHLSQFGLDSLTPDESQDLLELVIRSRRALTVAVALDLDRIQSYIRERSDIPPLLQSMLRRDIRRECRGVELHEVLREAPNEQHANSHAPHKDLDVRRPLPEIGIDSLTAILIRNQLSKVVGLTLSANIVFINPNLAALSQSLLYQLQNSRTEESTHASQSEVGPPPSGDSSGLDISAIRNGCIDPSFTFHNAAQSSTRPESALVTGATGFVGAFIVHGLLDRGIATHCVVRANCVKHAQHRIVSTLQHYGLWKASYAPLLHPLVGDVSQFQLGLGGDVFNDLTDCIDLIFHASGLADWMLPLEDYVGPNFISTHEVLRLATIGRSKAVHLISTVATLPRYMGYEVREDELEYCYATSKYIAERMVAAACWRGAKASVYRLPFITASAATGHFRLDRGDFLHNIIVGSLEMGSFPLLDADLSIILPVDYLSETIITVATQYRGRIGQDFDFTNAHAPSSNYFFKLMAIAGSGQTILPFPAWRHQALVHAAKHPKSPLARTATVIDGCTKASAAAMFKGPLGGAHVFGGEDHPAPAVDEQYVRRYLGRIGAARAEIR
ncbi:hypothetical protein VN97_g4101 [Penicillium thymicola]|uniref:Carrier domain-containing protein n=1 Tax=Penicillium thymicola TaxID=293382 RepID=A0AAI9XAG9_PENTH|nr:hypothetical protein VN97_g4101 [Penicillium thymicola]